MKFRTRWTNWLKGGTHLAMHMYLLQAVQPARGLWALWCQEGTIKFSNGIPCLAQTPLRDPASIFEAMKSTGSFNMTASSRVSGATSISWPSAGTWGTFGWGWSTCGLLAWSIGYVGVCCGKGVVVEIDSTSDSAYLKVDGPAAWVARRLERLCSISIKLNR